MSHVTCRLDNSIIRRDPKIELTPETLWKRTAYNNKVSSFESQLQIQPSSPWCGDFLAFSSAEISERRAVRWRLGHRNTCCAGRDSAHTELICSGQRSPAWHKRRPFGDTGGRGKNWEMRWNGEVAKNSEFYFLELGILVFGSSWPSVGCHLNYQWSVQALGLAEPPPKLDTNRKTHKARCGEAGGDVFNLRYQLISIDTSWFRHSSFSPSKTYWPMRDHHQWNLAEPLGGQSEGKELKRFVSAMFGVVSPSNLLMFVEYVEW